MKKIFKTSVVICSIIIFALLCCSCTANNDDNNPSTPTNEPTKTLETVQATQTIQATQSVQPTETIQNEETSSSATYTKPDFEITMEPGFSELELASATYFYLNDNRALIIIKEDFAMLEEATELNESATPLEYCEVVRTNSEAMGTSPSDITVSDNGVTYFTYENTSLGVDYFYTSTVFKGSDAFWLCTFYCPLENKTQFENVFLDWAATIKVA